MPLKIAESVGKECWRGYVEPEAGLSLPCTIVRGRAPGPKLIVTAGIHGAEYSGIEAARRLASISPGELRGELVILHIVNIKAFWTHRAFFNPSDDKNINRMFPGNSNGSASERLTAWLLGTAISGMDAYIDLHSGDVVEALTPFSIFPAGHARSEAMAIASGLPFAVRSEARGHSYIAAAAAGVLGVLLESGANGLWSEESIGWLEGGVKRIMAHLGMLPASDTAMPRPRLCRMEVMVAPAAGFWHPAVSPGSTVARGDQIGTIYDIVGAWERQVLAEHGGPVLYNLTSLAVNASQALIGIAV